MPRFVASLFLLVPCLMLGIALSGRREAAAPATLDGIVVSQGKRIEQARVRFQAGATLTNTDPRGRFSLVNSQRRMRITAAKEGYLNGSTWSDSDPLRIVLDPLPVRDFEDYAWIDPSPSAARHMACGNCHTGIQHDWETSAHSRSATNRRLINLYDGSTSDGRTTAGWNLLKEHPDGAGVCAACHAPTFQPSAVDGFDLRPARDLKALSGVHCDYCHKVQGPAAGEIGLTHGRFGLQLLRPAQGQLFFGPLDDVDRGEDAWSPFQRQSRFCASCHEGVVFGVPVYTTYSEWLVSPAAKEGKQCQDCHMTPTGRMTNIAPGHGGIERDPRTLGNHRFFDESLELMLKRSLSLQIDVRQTAGNVVVQASIRADDVGHRVPTGFVDRNLVLIVEAIDGHGRNLAPLSGPVLPAVTGTNVSGKGGRLYAKQLRDFDGKSPAPFWRADPEVVDTRLRPGEVDDSQFVFASGAARVTAKVLYRRFWPEVAAIKGWSGNEIEIMRRDLALPVLAR